MALISKTSQHVRQAQPKRNTCSSLPGERNPLQSIIGPGSRTRKSKLYTRLLSSLGKQPFSKKKIARVLSQMAGLVPLRRRCVDVAAAVVSIILDCRFQFAQAVVRTGAAHAIKRRCVAR